MRRNNKYRNRHKILQTLHSKLTDNETPNRGEGDIALTWTELVENSKLSETEVTEQIYYLIKEKEVIEQEGREEEALFEYDYIISRIGTASLYDKKYLSQSRKEWWNSTFDVLRTVSTAILLLVAIVTFVRNWIADSKNKCEIETLKEEVQQLKNQMNNPESVVIYESEKISHSNYCDGEVLIR